MGDNLDRDAVRETYEKVPIYERIHLDERQDVPVKVSIVIPVYNVERYLRECLESAVNQTLREIEILCVNDGSTDGSMEILREYAGRDSRVKVLHKANAGYGHSVNLGMDLASGEYIGILESDDYADIHMYEELYAAARENDADIAKGDFCRFETWGGQREELYIKSAYTSYYGRVIDPGEDPKVFKFNMQTWAGIYRRRFLEEHNIRHNESPGASFQDNGFHYKTFCWAKRLFYVNKPFYFYRYDNPDSSVHHKGKTDRIRDEFDRMERYALENHVRAPFTGLLYWKKFKSYLFTLERIGGELKKPFFDTFVAEFVEHRREGRLEKACFEEEEWELLEWMLEAPEEFFRIRAAARKVSVIIPVYNVEAYLEECLESVLGQTLREIEVICIDDGSTDGSLALLRRIAKTDRRMRVYCQSNTGAGPARNKGIRMAHGEFVAFMDPDDYYPDSDILETLYQNAKRYDVLISGGSFSDWVDGRVNTVYKGTLVDYVFGRDGIVNYSEYQFDYGFHRFLYDTAMLRENHIYFPALRRYQDPPFFVRAMITAQRFYAAARIVYRYRRGGRPMVWTKEKLSDALGGVLMNLRLSDQMHYRKLHSITVQRIFLTFLNPVADLYDMEDLELMELLSKVNRAVNEELIDPEIVPRYRRDFLWAVLTERYSRECQGRLSSKWDGMKKQADHNARELAEIRKVLEGTIADNNRYLTEILSIRASFSYRLAMMITWMPRKLRALSRRNAARMGKEPGAGQDGS